MARDEYGVDPDKFGDDGYQDLSLPNVAWNETDEEAKHSHNFRLEPGTYVLECKGIPVGDKSVQEKVSKVKLPDGSPAILKTNLILVEFVVHGLMLPDGTERLPSLRDSFLVPPADKSMVKAYFEGVAEGKKQAGWQAGKYRHFLGRLGWDFPKGTMAPPEANKTSLWRGVGIKAEVVMSTDWTDDQGAVRKGGFPQIKPYSYERLTRDEAAQYGLSRIVNNTVVSTEGDEDDEESEPAPPPKKKKLKDVNV